MKNNNNSNNQNNEKMFVIFFLILQLYVFMFSNNSGVNIFTAYYDAYRIKFTYCK